MACCGLFHFYAMKTVTAFFLSLFLLMGCQSKEHTQIQIYEGPLREAEGVELDYSENDMVTVKMRAEAVFEFQNGDREFPKGLYLEFYDEFGKLSSTLRADHAFYVKEEDRWRARGKVEVINKLKNEQLNTEELFWEPAKEKIYTDSFVTIRQQNDVLYGQGLEAKQDMSSYTIKKPQGEIEIKENEEPVNSRQEM